MVFSFLFVSSIILVVTATNDWSKPCFSGECEYDLLPSNGTASGTLKIWGPESTIGDITPAGGWEILNCSPDLLQQDIRLVCKDGKASDCGRLFNNATDTGHAVGKVVRLPEHCGQNAFAIVTKAEVASDQSGASGVARRDGTPPTVHALSLDTKLSAKRSAGDVVKFALRAANIPGANGDLAIPTQQQGRSIGRGARRGFWDWVGNTINEITSLNDWNLNESETLPPIDYDKTVNLLDQSVSCGPVSASVNVNANANAHAVVSFGVVATGTYLPPWIDDFAVVSTLNANLAGSLNLHAGASGSIDSGKVKLYQVGIPGLDFPGILTIGPTFEIDAEASANFNANVDATVGINYAINQATFTFPSRSSSGGHFNVGDTPVTLSASASGTVSGGVNGQIVPTLNFGISALGGIVTADVFLDVEAAANINLSAQGGASAGNTVSPSTSYGGCVDVGASLDVNVGASGDFFGLFDKSTKVSLYDHKFDIFNKCYGSSATRRTVSSRIGTSRLTHLAKRALTCPAANLAPEQSIISQIIPAKNIKQL